MDEIVKSAARAIYESGGGQMLQGNIMEAPPWEEVDPHWVGLFCVMAQAVIKLIRPQEL